MAAWRTGDGAVATADSDVVACFWKKRKRGEGVLGWTWAGKKEERRGKELGCGLFSIFFSSLLFFFHMIKRE